MNKFYLEPVTDDSSWDVFVEASPQGTIFALSNYLDLSVDHYHRFWIYKGNQKKAGLSLVTNADGNNCILDDLVIHNGLMFANDPYQKATKTILERFELTEFVVEWLVEKYNTIDFALAPQFQDLRPFLWYNYHSPGTSDRFNIGLKYTSYLSIASLSFVDDEQKTALFRELETLRQRNIREARKHGARSEQIGDVGMFLQYYGSLMHRQGDPPDDNKLKHIERLISGLINEGKAAIWLSMNGHDEPLYAIVFVWDSKRAYYLFGAPSTQAEARYQGTIAFWDAFRALAKDGIKEVDMEGVNSPSRGWFKLSFGGNLLPYYQISLGRNGY